MLDGPKRALLGGLTALLLGLGTAGQATAACTDPPRPGVDWRRCYLDEMSYVGRDLSDAKLRDASFTHANLSATRFVGADARRAKFFSAKLEGAAFDQAHLFEADFTRADLAGASFRHADLRRARFFDANLRRTDFTGARLRGADFLNADLSGALWTDGKTRCAEGSLGQCD